mmetsp:Transcript_298/g.437  ORF Transcript_298/g.437 Transcript_298/m.437 type:complete len:130 (-) Transcript_298:1083-1472(-)
MDPRACRSNFCAHCGSLLATPNSDDVICNCCGAVCSYGDFDSKNLKIETFSAPQKQPKWIQDQNEMFAENKTQDKKNAHNAHRATVNEVCPKCSHGVASFYTMQLRSVDEGQTVFYECLKCANTWSQNN